MPKLVEQALGAGAAAAGLAGVACSVMIYADTRRPFWDVLLTAPKFMATAALLGLPAALLISIAATLFSHVYTVQGIMAGEGKSLCRWIVAVAAGKLALESLIFVSLRHKDPTPLKRTALLMTGELGLVTIERFFFGVVGGLLLPWLLLMEDDFAPDGYHPAFIGLIVAVSLAVLLAGELMERYLFFTAVVAPKMPGSPAS